MLQLTVQDPQTGRVQEVSIPAPLLRSLLHNDTFLASAGLKPAAKQSNKLEFEDLDPPAPLAPTRFVHIQPRLCDVSVCSIQQPIRRRWSDGRPVPQLHLLVPRQRRERLGCQTTTANQRRRIGSAATARRLASSTQNHHSNQPCGPPLRTRPALPLLQRPAQCETEWGSWQCDEDRLIAADHFYTTRKGEGGALYKLEGVAGKIAPSPGAVPGLCPNLAPFHRLYEFLWASKLWSRSLGAEEDWEMVAENHFYTADSAQKASAEAQGYQSEGSGEGL